MSPTRARRDILAGKASEIMQTDVVCLDTTASIADAVRTFEEYSISGAPVVNAGGVLVGVLSAFDITRSNHVDSGGIAGARNEYYLTNPIDESEDLFGDEEILAKNDYSGQMLGGERVEDWMSPKVISVDPDASVRAVCRKMVDERIHRVLVTQEDRLLGILSSFDVVKHIAESG